LGYDARYHPLARKPYFELLGDLFNPSTRSHILISKRYELDLFAGYQVRVSLHPLKIPLLTQRATPIALVEQLEILDDGAWVEPYRSERERSSTLIQATIENMAQIHGDIAKLNGRLTRHDEQVAEFLELQIRQENLAIELAELDRNWQVMERGAELVGGTIGSKAQILLVMERIRRAETRQLNEIALPATVQIAGDSNIGSGVILDLSEYDANANSHYVLTSWHVVRNILGSEQDDLSKPIPIFATWFREKPVEIHASFEPAASAVTALGQSVFRGFRAVHPPIATAEANPNDLDSRRFLGQLVAHDTALDLAMLRTFSNTAYRKLPLLNKDALAKLELTMGDGTWLIGCPLGIETIPTYGYVGASRHLVDGSNYWMISAPGYPGNSGGPAWYFDRVTGTNGVISIYNKVYTYGSLHSFVAAHMGLLTDPYALRDWIDGVMRKNSLLVHNWNRPK
jgi:hypothetical protein